MEEETLDEEWEELPTGTISSEVLDTAIHILRQQQYKNKYEMAKKAEIEPETKLLSALKERG